MPSPLCFRCLVLEAIILCYPHCLSYCPSCTNTSPSVSLKCCNKPQGILYMYSLFLSANRGLRSTSLSLNRLGGFLFPWPRTSLADLHNVPFKMSHFSSMLLALSHSFINFSPDFQVPFFSRLSFSLFHSSSLYFATSHLFTSALYGSF